MPTWHLPQVLAMFAWLIGESRSTPRLMSWTPWQSLQDGATISPIFSSAGRGCCPCIATAASGYFIWYSLVRPGLLWHLAQVCGRFSLKTGESACLTGRMSCEPWQSQQLAAPEAPSAWLTPWMLVA